VSGEDEHEPHDRRVKDITDETAARHVLEGRMAYATVEALRALESKVDDMTGALKEMRGWMMGTASSDGHVTPGVLQTVGFMRYMGTAIVTLLGTIAMATISMAVHTIFFGGH
jgi:hypothetical protein